MAIASCFLSRLSGAIEAGHMLGIHSSAGLWLFITCTVYAGLEAEKHVLVQWLLTQVCIVYMLHLVWD